MKIKRARYLSLYSALILISALTPFFYFVGCVRVPDQLMVVSGRGDALGPPVAGVCGSGVERERLTDFEQGLDPEGFSVLSWNTHKGTGVDWFDDLSVRARGVDLILLQEAALSEELRDQLKLLSEEWTLAIAFKSGERDIGVLSAAMVSPYNVCAVREVEPLIQIPKVALATTYPLLGVGEQLLVVNLHMVNFTLSSERVSHQIAGVTSIIENHEGPVIVAGDFNTWNESRERLIGEAMQRLELSPVTFDPDLRARFFNKQVDGIFYRGLEVLSSFCEEVDTSDHNPLTVQFRYKEQLRS